MKSKNDPKHLRFKQLVHARDLNFSLLRKNEKAQSKVGRQIKKLERSNVKALKRKELASGVGEGIALAFELMLLENDHQALSESSDVFNSELFTSRYIKGDLGNDLLLAVSEAIVARREAKASTQIMWYPQAEY